MTIHHSTPPMGNDLAWHQLRFALYRLTYRVQTPMLLPEYKGSVFRGAIGHHIKRVSDQAFHRLFATTQETVRRTSEGETTSPFLANLNEVPPPYILEPPLTSKRFFEQGEVLEAHLILVGEAIDFLPFFVFALVEAGKGGLGSRIDNRRGTGELLRIESLNGWEDSAPTVVYTGAEQILSDATVVVRAQTICGQKLNARQCQLRFVTPARFRLRGRLADEVPFEVLLRALMRRVSALAYYYCGMDLFFSPADLLEKAGAIKTESSSLQWFDWKRGSRRQGRCFQMGGVVGTVVYAGDFLPFTPFLRLGEYLHVGKGVSLGLGKYRIEAGN